ncbi:hypothetical protein [Aurantimonas sp. 22II-16-19i]|uniref:hypothetical protein n=1 Tax=Aurantimonas sp. 22II-16-19i TaxID=1317114 RepID=UPI0009F7BF74|nr:hypothetical protein [Aurantimonas sp. 22II-16-19i]ORE97250.1 hypothetical protein ATO4_09371 [Aurantimonas sp. 22II-16-19i]
MASAWCRAVASERLVRVLIAGLALASALAAPAVAQVPDHVPGTICFTERFWCWALPPGTPGADCVCQSVAGPQKGKLG